jgi:hypothetical protein
MKNWLSLTLLLLFTQMGMAQQRCRWLFEDKQALSEKIYNKLSPERLRTEGFEINEKLELIDVRLNHNLGKIEAREVKHTYNWSTAESQKFNYEMGEVTPGKMDYAMNKAQAAGPGVYVSEHPLNSIRFGDGLTTFVTTGSLIILTHSAPLDQIETAHRLSRAGVDAFVHSSETTWYSMINRAQLKTSHFFDHGYWDKLDLTNLFSTLLYKNRFKSSTIYENLPSDNIYRHFLESQLTASEVESIRKQWVLENQESSIDFKKLLPDKLFYKQVGQKMIFWPDDIRRLEYNDWKAIEKIVPDELKSYIAELAEKRKKL